jgi:trk system potassium uptake protein TrkA
MKKQFVVLGCGRFGAGVALKLADLGAEVMVVDKSEEIIQTISERVTFAIQADLTDENSIRTLGIRNFDVAIVAIGTDMQSSILVTLMVKEMGIKLIIAKAHNELHAKVLYKIGADRVVLPEREMGIRIAKNLMSANFLDHVELAPDYSIVELVALKEWHHRTLIECDLRTKYGINVMAIRRGIDISIAISPEDTIEPNDVLIVIGNNADLKKIERF